MGFQGDVLKAVALGAKGVGIGRPFLYAYSACEHLSVLQSFIAETFFRRARGCFGCYPNLKG